MFGRNKTSRLINSHIKQQESATVATARARDKRVKFKAKMYQDRRKRARTRAFRIGDLVFYKDRQVVNNVLKQGLGGRGNEWQHDHSQVS